MEERPTRLFTEGTARILLGAELEQTRDTVAQALEGWSRTHAMQWVSQPDLLLPRAEDLVPHVILLEDELAGADTIPLLRQLRSRVPSAALLLLVEETAIGLLQKAVQAGVSGFIPKPLKADDILANVRGAAEGEPPQETDADRERPLGSAVVVCAAKGGTGRTTLAINTAISLREISRRPVALVDADYAAPALDVALNLDASRTIAGLTERVARVDDVMIRSVMADHVSGVEVLLAPPPSEPIDFLTSPQVQHILVQLKRMYAWVVIDLGLGLDDIALAFLDGSDAIVLSILPEMVGLRNARLLLDQFAERGYPSGKTRLVLNAATMNGGVPRRDIEKRLSASFDFAIPSDQLLATHSVNRGVPLTMSHPRSAVARAVRKLSQSLVTDLQPETPSASAEAGASRRRGLFRKRPAGAG